MNQVVASTLKSTVYEKIEHEIKLEVLTNVLIKTAKLKNMNGYIDHRILAIIITIYLETFIN